MSRNPTRRNPLIEKIVGQDALRDFEALGRVGEVPAVPESAKHLSDAVKLAGIDAMRDEADRLAEKARVDLLNQADRDADLIRALLRDEVDERATEIVQAGANG